VLEWWWWTLGKFAGELLFELGILLEYMIKSVFQRPHLGLPSRVLLLHNRTGILGDFGISIGVGSASAVVIFQRAVEDQGRTFAVLFIDDDAVE
jgi:hypothetical protein